MIIPTTVFGAANKDEDSHWGIKGMQEWVDKGLLTGFPDGTLRPNDPVTRAQFARMINSVFHYGLVEKAPFSDVYSFQWFNNDVASVSAAGVIDGYPDGTFKAHSQVLREDAAKMLAAAFKLSRAAEQQSTNLLEGFKDGSEVHTYARPALEELIAAGVMHGYADHTIRPLKALTRAEAVALISALTGTIVQAKGEYKDMTIEGNLVVNAPGVTLDHVIVKGNVYLTAGIGEGDVHISNSQIEGVLHVNGGGVNSIYIEHTNIGTLIVNKLEGNVRIVIREKSEVTELTVESQAVIELDKDSFIKLLTFLESAKGSELLSNGTIEKILNNAGIKIPTDPGSTEGSSGTPSTTPKPTNPPEEWKLVWNDEFDGKGKNLDTNGIDLDKWGYQLGTGAQYGLDGWGNNEQQYYLQDNISVKNGLLTITAKEESHDGKPYTSGRLYTEQTFSQTYGKFEARIKMPAGEGLEGIWPAFWMMPKDSEYGVWAASGELDIMEARGRVVDSIGGAVHFGKNWPNNVYTANDYHFAEGENITDFHVYGLEWEPGELRWYVDGELFQKVSNWNSWGAGQPAKYAFPAPFDKPFYMILNMAVGGNFDGGLIPDSSMLPAEMLVDYVRVYELQGRPYRTVEEPSVEVEPITAPYKEAIDGNYIYDNSYQESITHITESDQLFNESYWNLVNLSSFNGTADTSVETLDNVRYAKTNITAAGSEVHSVQLIQNVTVGKGRWYKLSFDAKSDENRNMTVKIGGGESRGWSVYSDSMEARLSDSVQSYEMVFQMSAETDKLARLEFNMGLNNRPVWIGNVKLEETTAPDPFKENDDKEPLADGNHVYNGSFDLGYIHRMTYWQLHNMGMAAANASVDSVKRELKVNITKPGKAADDITFIQNGISIIDGNEYELTFKARASQQRTINVGLLKKDGSALATPQSITLTKEMQTHTVKFSIEGATESIGQLAFMLGGTSGDVYIDDIRLIRTTNNNVDGLPLELQFPLKNGDFTNGTNNWNEHVQGRYDGNDEVTSFRVVDDELKFDIWSIGNNPWDVMLMQTDLPLKKNQIYTVTLDAKASKNREIEIVLEDSGFNRYVSELVQLTTEWKSFTYELPMDSDAVTSFKLLLGKIENAAAIGPHTVWVDNVRVEVKDARSKAFLAVNGYFDEGMKGWSTHVQGVYEQNRGSATFSAATNALYASINHPGAEPWDIVLFQDAVALKKENTYIVSFVAKASSARSIDVVVENSSYHRYLDENLQLSDVSQTYSFELAMTKDDMANLKFLFGKQSNDGEGASDVYIDNVRFELKGAQEATGELARSQNDIPELEN